MTAETSREPRAHLTFPAAIDPRFPRHASVWMAVEQRLPPAEMAHDALHMQRVYRWSLRLAPEGGADADLAGAMALVHDLAFVPKDSPERATGGERSALVAGSVLLSAGYSATDTATIAEAVRTSSWSRGLIPTNSLGVVLQDADRLDAIGAIGVMRTMACAQFMSSMDRPGCFYHPQDPFRLSTRPLNDRTYALDHCHAKLLSLCAGMRLQSARAEAQRRHDWLLGFIQELASELAE